MEYLFDILECQFCLEFSVSPIHNCVNGHIVCGICVETLKKCGQCQEEFSPCAFAERLAKRSEIDLPCKKNDPSCTEMVKSTEMNKHLATQCGARQFPCLLKGTDGCAEDLNIKDLPDHLRVRHNIRHCICDITGMTCVLYWYYSFFADYTNDSLDRLNLIEYDEKIFLYHRRVEDSLVFEWVSVIGPESLAKKYRYIMKFPRKLEVASYSWTLPVVSVYDCEFNKVKALGQVGHVHLDTLDKRKPSASMTTIELIREIIKA